MLDGRCLGDRRRQVRSAPARIPTARSSRTAARCASSISFSQLKFEDVHPGSSSVKERLAVMDETGIYAQIVYPNILGFGGQAAAKVDPALRQVCVEIYNDAMAELQEESGQRLFPMALLPWWDVKAAVKETERAAHDGLARHQHQFRSAFSQGRRRRPHSRSGQPALGSAVGSVRRQNMPVNFHIGASETVDRLDGQQGWPSLPRDLRSGIWARCCSSTTARSSPTSFTRGPLDRFPTAQVRLGGKRRRLGAVPDGSARLPADGNRRGQEVRHEAVGIFPNAISTPASGSRRTTSRTRCDRSASTTCCSKPTSRIRPVSIRSRIWKVASAT